MTTMRQRIEAADTAARELRQDASEMHRNFSVPQRSEGERQIMATLAVEQRLEWLGLMLAEGLR